MTTPVAINEVGTTPVAVNEVGTTPVATNEVATTAEEVGATHVAVNEVETTADEVRATPVAITTRIGAEATASPLVAAKTGAGCPTLAWPVVSPEATGST